MNIPAEIQPHVSRDTGVRWWPIAALLLIGVAAWLTIGRAIIDWPNQVAVLMSAAVVAVLTVIPMTRRLSVEWLTASENFLQNRAGITAIIITIFSAAY